MNLGFFGFVELKKSLWYWSISNLLNNFVGFRLFCPLKSSTELYEDADSCLIIGIKVMIWAEKFFSPHFVCKLQQTQS